MLRQLGAAFIGLAFVSTAIGQVVNVTVNGVVQTPVASGDPIHVTVSTTGITSVRLTGSTAETDIGRLLLHGATDGRVDVLVGTVEDTPAADFPDTPDDNLIDAGRHWGGLVCDDFNLRGSTRVAFAISGDVKSLHTGEAGSVLVGQVYRGQVGGSARADIRAAPLLMTPMPDGEAVARLFVNGTVESGVTLCAEGGKGKLDTLVVGLPGSTGVTMRGTIFGDAVYDVVVHGRIENAGPRPAVYSSYSDIRSLIAGGVVGDVVAGLEGQGNAPPQIGRLICAGNFTGTIVAPRYDADGSFCDGIRIDGALNGMILEGIVFDGGVEEGGI